MFRLLDCTYVHLAVLPRKRGGGQVLFDRTLQQWCVVDVLAVYAPEHFGGAGRACKGQCKRTCGTL